jgi:hypothetical protein
MGSRRHLPPMSKLIALLAALALLGLVAGCGQSACNAHPNGLACEEQRTKHSEAESANRTKEEQNTPQAKEERKEREKRQEEKELHESNHEFMCEKFHSTCTSEFSGEQVAEKVTAQVEPSGRLGGNEKFSCPEGKYAEGSHLVCTLTGSNGSQEFEVTLESGTIKVNVKEETPAGEGG